MRVRGRARARLRALPFELDALRIVQEACLREDEGTPPAFARLRARIEAGAGPAPADPPRWSWRRLRAGLGRGAGVVARRRVRAGRAAGGGRAGLAGATRRRGHIARWATARSPAWWRRAKRRCCWCWRRMSTRRRPGACCARAGADRRWSQRRGRVRGRGGCEARIPSRDALRAAPGCRWSKPWIPDRADDPRRSLGVAVAAGVRVRLRLHRVRVGACRRCRRRPRRRSRPAIAGS